MMARLTANIVVQQLPNGGMVILDESTQEEIEVPKHMIYTFIKILIGFVPFQKFPEEKRDVE